MQKQIFFSFVLVMVLVEKVKAQCNNPFGNTLIPDMIADASIQEINGVLYCYATANGYGQRLKISGPPVVWKPKDFVRWSFDGTYFPSAAREKYWAPSKAIFANDKYHTLEFPTLINGWKNNSLSNFLCKLVIDKQLISRAKRQSYYGSKNRENI